MNQDQIINKLAQISGRPRKDVIEVLKKMSAMPEVQKELKKNRKR